MVILGEVYLFRSIIIKPVYYLIGYLISYFGRSISFRNIIIKPVHYLIGYLISYFGRSIVFRNIIIKPDHYSIKELKRSKNVFLSIYRCLNTDVLELYETDEQGDEVVHRFCGKVFPSPIMARREIRIRFKSMKESSHQGFKARFEFLTNAQLNTGK